jgi:hypothetical protein
LFPDGAGRSSAQVVPADLEQASVILASFVYHAATRDAMLPRPALPLAR